MWWPKKIPAEMCAWGVGRGRVFFSFSSIMDRLIFEKNSRERKDRKNEKRSQNVLPFGRSRYGWPREMMKRKNVKDQQRRPRRGVGGKGKRGEMDYLPP